ncbi:COG1470 family protein [Streptomyces sulfonofaciens]|uniref:COG1470 family protein n=1 Tax=Streptomyces sulfonofaciens TaxID=68272 RepID=UPI00167A46EE|nr:hydrolytic protein [Streptomyces sulfonofaciens]
MTTAAELATPTVTVSPGGTATTTLTVRNDSDIVEGYALEVVGDCAAWSTVEPPRVSLYPGTSETVTVRLAPPRSSRVRAGEVPLGVRVLPAERPESVVVPETTVTIEPFWELRAELAPQRRRGWLGARYRTALRNQGNTPVGVALSAEQAGEEMRFAFAPGAPELAPGESAEVRLRVRIRKPIWFGKPVTWPFQVGAGPTGEGVPEQGQERQPGRPAPLEGEFVQLSLLPRWLLAVLAALLALLLAWFALVRPAVQSTAKEAAEEAAKNPPPVDGGGQAGRKGAGPASGDEQEGTGTGTGSGGSGGGGGSGGQGRSGGGSPVGGRQSSATIDVRTGPGARKVGAYTVPQDKVFNVTDIVVANYQGDEGLLTIAFGERTITTIALETFRNQDYHWVTPIEIPENATVTADVTCRKPGTPASGKQASGCAEVLNVSGVLSDLKN